MKLNENLFDQTNIKFKRKIQNEALSDVEDKAIEVQNPTYADAIRDIKKADKQREEASKIAATPKTEEKPKNPQMANGAKQMKLDESLFESWYDTDDDPYAVITWAKDGSYDNTTFTDDFSANAMMQELKQMSEQELAEQDIVAAAQVEVDEYGTAYIVNSFGNISKDDIIELGYELDEASLNEAMDNATKVELRVNRALSNWDGSDKARKRLEDAKEAIEIELGRNNNGQLRYLLALVNRSLRESLNESNGSLDRIKQELYNYYGSKLDEIENIQVVELALIIDGYNPKWAVEATGEPAYDEYLNVKDQFLKAYVNMLTSHASQNESLDEYYYYTDEYGNDLNNNEIVLIIGDDYTEPFFYKDYYQADSHYGELIEMSEEELKKERIVGFAQISEGKVINIYYGSDEEKVRYAVESFVGEPLEEDIRVDAMNRKRPTTYVKRENKKPISLQIYDGLDKLGYEVFAGRKPNTYWISKRKESNLERAKNFLDNLGISYDRSETQGRIILTINVPNDEEEVNKYFKATDRLMVTENQNLNESTWGQDEKKFSSNIIKKLEAIEAANLWDDLEAEIEDNTKYIETISTDTYKVHNQELINDLKQEDVDKDIKTMYSMIDKIYNSINK